MSTLKKDWSPAYGIEHILTVIKCLLISPNPDSALDPEAARLLQEVSFCAPSTIVVYQVLTMRFAFLSGIRGLRLDSFDLDARTCVSKTGMHA